MRRGVRAGVRAGTGAAATELAALVAVALGAVTDSASATAGGWAGRPWVVWTAFSVLSAVSAGLAVLSRRMDAAGPAAVIAGGRPGSLRPPHIGAERIHGRSQEISRLRALLKKPGGRFAVVCAAGGVGKTTLAAALAEHARRDGYAVFWIRWRGPETLADDFVQAAAACGMPRAAVSAAPTGSGWEADAVWRQLACTRKWLLVLDNFDETAAVGPDGERVADYRGWIRPDGCGLLLVTSRDTSAGVWGSAAELLRLTPLDASAGGRVLLDAAPAAGTPAQAEALAARLGGLPLALRAAGRYVSGPTSRHRTFAGYQNALEAELPALIGAEDPQAADPDVARSALRHTWEISLDQLAREGVPLARPLLRQLALFAEAPVPLTLISPELLATAARQPVGQAALDQALAGLERYGLLGAPEEPAPGASTGAAAVPASGSVTLHPLVREIGALALATDTPERLPDCRRALVDALRRAPATVQAAGPPGWPVAHLLAPHLPELLDHPDLIPFEDACAALDQLADVLGDCGSYARQLALRQAVLGHRVRRAGDDDPDTLTARNHLANSLHSTGGYERSRELHQRNLTDRTRVLGAAHPDTLTSRSNVGYVLHLLGDHPAAAAVHEEVLADRARVLGPDHPHTLTSRDNWAAALDRLGDHARAIALHEQNIAERTRVLGADHARTLTSRDNLAAAVDHSGEHARATALHEEVLADRARVLGPDHPHTLTSRNNLAVALQGLGRLAEAADLHERTAADRARVLGPDHPQTVASRERLADCRARLAGGSRRRRRRPPPSP